MKYKILALTLSCLFIFSGCNSDAGNDVGNAVNDVTDGVGDAIDDVTDGVENAVDDATGDRDYTSGYYHDYIDDSDGATDNNTTNDNNSLNDNNNAGYNNVIRNSNDNPISGSSNSMIENGDNIAPTPTR